MKYQDGFDEIMKRMHLPENSKKYNQLNICPKSLEGMQKMIYDAVYDFRKITKELEEQDEDQDTRLKKNRKWHELQRKIPELLDKDNWK